MVEICYIWWIEDICRIYRGWQISSNLHYSGIFPGIKFCKKLNMLGLAVIIQLTISPLQQVSLLQRNSNKYILYIFWKGHQFQPKKAKPDQGLRLWLLLLPLLSGGLCFNHECLRPRACTCRTGVKPEEGYRAEIYHWRYMSTLTITLWPQIHPLTSTIPDIIQLTDANRSHIHTGKWNFPWRPFICPKCYRDRREQTFPLPRLLCILFSFAFR